MTLFHNAIPYISLMRRKFKFVDNGKLYFVSFAITNWTGKFIRNEYKEEMPESKQHLIRFVKIQSG